MFDIAIHQFFGTKLRTIVAIATVAALLPACGGRRAPAGGSPSVPSAKATEALSPGVRIAAASDLQFALKEVISAFAQEHPNIPVTPTFGSSGNFFAQIQNGAPFDLFLSAEASYPQKLEAAGLADRGSLFQYAIGRIVVFTRSDSPIDIKDLKIKALTDPSIHKIAIAAPEHAPYGKAAEAAMKSLGVYDMVKAKLVLGENISQTAQFVQSGSADIGIIALSLALGPNASGKYWEIPSSAHPALLQAGAILTAAKDKRAAKTFRDFMRSAKGISIMKKFGFVLPKS